MNPFTDKYFTKARLVAAAAGLNPEVSYRVFGRFDGIAALEPAKDLIETLAPQAEVKVLPTGTEFKTRDTIMTITGKFQDIVELETMYLQWCALPCYCAKQAYEILLHHRGPTVDFAARHLFGAESVALASYGAEIGGITTHSTDIGANARVYLKNLASYYNSDIYRVGVDYPRAGIGTIPHALLAIFDGNYIDMAKAYFKKFPEDDRFVALIDYNNKEVQDTLSLFSLLKEKLWGVRIDTAGENFAQIRNNKKACMPGVCIHAVEELRRALDSAGASDVKIIVSSGFDHEKAREFGDQLGGCPDSFDIIGTGSFIPKLPQCTSDIFNVDGFNECKVGREWGYESNNTFYKRLANSLP